MTYAVWNLGGGVCVGLEPCDPEEGPVARLTAAQLHRLALYVQLEIDIAQEDEARAPRPTVRPQYDATQAMSQEQLAHQHGAGRQFPVVANLAADENPGSHLIVQAAPKSICGEPREMGNKIRHCDLKPAHGGDFHSVTLEELGGGTSQWPVVSEPVVPAEECIDCVTQEKRDAAALDPTLPLFAQHDGGLPAPPDPDRLVRRRESEQQKREQLLANGWTEHRDIYDQNIAQCWENGGKWVDVHQAFEQMLSEKARAELTRQGWTCSAELGDGVERWSGPGCDKRRIWFPDALRQIGIDPSFISPRMPLDAR